MIASAAASLAAFVVSLSTAAAILNVPADEPAGGVGSRARLWTAAELREALGQANAPRVLDARPRADYDKGHIPGALWVDARAIGELSAKPGALGDPNAWRPWIESLGIGPETDVVVYDANRQLDAARIWWLLSYLGVARAGLLDGGFPLWVAANLPLSAEAPAIAPRPFPVAPQRERLATRADVLDALGKRSSKIVDVRSRPEFTGVVKRSKRGGHIPTACHVEWSEVLDENGRFLPAPELRKLLEPAGIGAGEPVITHCQSGGRASVSAFALERLGHPVRNYYESWGDWGNAEDTPIESNAPGR